MIENEPMSYPVLLGQTIETAFEAAKGIATLTFMAGMPFQIERNTLYESSVEFDSLTKSNVLHTTASSPFVSSMAEVFGNYQDAWLLTLAHEYGHMQLNQMCVNASANPANPNDQVAAMGIKLTETQRKWLPNFHKESAIEAYCDASLLEYAKNNYPNHWNDIANKLLEIRNLNSVQFKRIPEQGRYGDEYFCSQPIRTSIQQRKILTKSDAAKLALQSSIENTPLPMDIINASHIAIDDLAERLKPDVPHEHQKLIQSSIAALGRIHAGYHNLKTKLEERRSTATGPNKASPLDP
jgi:hypothetical protein